MDDLRNRLQKYATRLYGYAYVLAKDPTEAEDLVQETFLKAMTAARPPKNPTSFRPWLFRILRNSFIDWRRRDNRIDVLDHDALDEELERTAPDPSADQPVITALTVRFGLMKLSPHHREVLALVDIAGFSYAETAEILDIAPGTVMSRVSRARAGLLEAIEETNIVPMSRSRSV